MTIKKKLLLSVVMMALIVSGLVIFGAITINSFQETSLIPEGGAMAIQSDTNSSLMAFYITGGIIVLMILAVGYLMMKSVVTPLNYAKVVADEIATGNLKAEFKFNNDDEIGETLSSIQEIVNNVSST